MVHTRSETTGNIRNRLLVGSCRRGDKSGRYDHARILALPVELTAQSKSKGLFFPNIRFGLISGRKKKKKSFSDLAIKVRFC